MNHGRRLDMRTLTYSLTLYALITLLALPAAADESRDDYTPTGSQKPFSPNYSGAFLSLGAFAGPAHTEIRTLQGQWATTYGAVAQLSSPLQVVDLQLAYARQDVQNTFDDGRRVQLGQNTISFGAGLHPFFLSHLGSSPFPWYLMGASHIFVGLDIDLVDGDIDGEEFFEADVGAQIGAGFDYPLDDVNDGGAFWIGAQYRFNYYRFEENLLRGLNARQHLILVRLSYRRNGLISAF